MFSWFKKDKKPGFDSLPRFPERGREFEWMSNKIKFYKTYYPESLPNLFSPACADYLPKACYVISGFDDNVLVQYRGLKILNPNAVLEARKITENIAGKIFLSPVGDVTDFYDVPNINN